MQKLYNQIGWAIDLTIPLAWVAILSLPPAFIGLDAYQTSVIKANDCYATGTRRDVVSVANEDGWACHGGGRPPFRPQQRVA